MMKKYKHIKNIFFLAIAFIALFTITLLLTKKDSHEEELGFDKPGKYMEYFHAISTPINRQSSGYKVNYKYDELLKAKQLNARFKNTSEIYPWVQRGPGNVGGRTRSIFVDPDDATHNTWYAGSASGGIWKTSDGGDTWQDLSPEFPNLSTSAIAMAASNHNIIYAGTGEGYGGVGMVAGNGIFKSINKGYDWNQLSSTANEDFMFVNVIIVDPGDDQIVIAGTNKGIFKSIDGGTSWTKVYGEGYAVQDIVPDPADFNTLYGAAYGLGILKSLDAGDTWNHSFNGIGEGGRFHLAVSPVSPNKIFTSVEAIGYDNGISQLETHVYVSIDKGENWSKFVSPYNFLGNQGWFNNIITAHPFDENIVFIAGVDFGKIEFKSGISNSEPQVIRVDTVGTASFMEFVNFGGRFLGGGMSTGDEEDGVEILSSDWSSVELRFGSGIKQKAYRFTVPEGEGAGVPPEDYSYHDYIDVPFEAWDTDNNRQLMVSFRDQERDGEFNLIDRDIDDDISGREYIFVHAVEYDSLTPSVKIAKDGGHTYKQLYFFWPILPRDSIWDETSLPNAKISIQYGTFSLINEESVVNILADYRKNNNLHVDHHEIIPIITDTNNEKFTILEANDGGLGISTNEGKSWEQINSGYITTQFYGVAKKHGAHEYIGGMQDNGTWQSPVNATASKTSEYDDKIGGDGFEVLWHPVYERRILGSSYNNRFYVSIDDGETWTRASQGINEDGPFISRLSNSPSNPNLVFAVGSYGVFRHVNFGFGKFDWEIIPIQDGWSINNVVTDQHNVKVSLANDSIIWAGAGMYPNPDLHLFVSKNRGNSFDSVSNYYDVELGYISGLATHPTEENTAYALFSLKDKPKILRTKNLGQTWEDISGFGTKDSSDTGFPDVMVHCLLVMPYNTDIIWAGTEIGIFESIDNANTWHYADNGLPAVSVWQLFIQDDNVVAATHGRGIWSLDLNLVNLPEKGPLPGFTFIVYPNPNKGNFKIAVENDIMEDLLIQVSSLEGKLVYSSKFTKNTRKIEKQINLTTLNPGNYLITTTQGNSKATRKVIVD